MATTEPNIFWRSPLKLVMSVWDRLLSQPCLVPILHHVGYYRCQKNSQKKIRFLHLATEPYIYVPTSRVVTIIKIRKICLSRVPWDLGLNVMAPAIVKENNIFLSTRELFVKQLMLWLLCATVISEDIISEGPRVLSYKRNLFREPISWGILLRHFDFLLFIYFIGKKWIFIVCIHS